MSGGEVLRNRWFCYQNIVILTIDVSVSGIQEHHFIIVVVVVVVESHLTTSTGSSIWNQSRIGNLEPEIEYDGRTSDVADGCIGLQEESAEVSQLTIVVVTLQLPTQHISDNNDEMDSISNKWDETFSTALKIQSDFSTQNIQPSNVDLQSKIFPQTREIVLDDISIFPTSVALQNMHGKCQIGSKTLQVVPHYTNISTPVKIILHEKHVKSPPFRHRGWWVTK